MQILILIALIGWLPICVLVFLAFPWRQAVLIAIMTTWLFLPPAGLNISGLPDYTKNSAFSYGVLLSLMIFAPDRLIRLKPSWMDLPALVFCLCPIATSLSNGLGLYDGFASANANSTYIGLPYFIGRVCFDSSRDLRGLGVAIVAGGVAYAPLCLLEMVIGPVLAAKVYALRLVYAVRLGGYRPQVFLSDGLELGLWMAVSTFIAIWLWRVGVLKRLAGVPFGPVLLPVLILTTLFCRSSGALLLLAVALTVVWASVAINRRIIMILWILACFLYVGVRVGNFWDYNALIRFLESNFDADRAQSLEFRLANEDILIAKALQSPLLGWGGFGRSRVYDETGKDISVVDGLWVGEFGQFGFIGLGSLLLLKVLPCLVFIRRFPMRRWLEPEVGAIAALVGGLTIYLGDIMLNGFIILPIIVAAGALTTVLQSPVLGLESSLGYGARTSVSERIFAEVDSPEERLAARYVEMARGLRTSGDYEGAASARRHAHELLTRAAEEAGDGPPASRRRRRLDNDNDLAWLLATRPDPAEGDREEAADLARRAAEADPDNPAYWNTLALALCRVGAYEDAQAAARRSMELDESWNGFDLAVLALADARLGRKGDAAPWLAQAVQWRDDRGSTDPALDALIRETESVLIS